MNRIATKALFVAGGLASVFALAIGGALAQSGAAQSAPAGPAPKMAEEVYKNIQVLKGVPADQLIPTMQFITASLGTPGSALDCTLPQRSLLLLSPLPGLCLATVH